MKLKRLEILNIASYKKCIIDFDSLDYPVFITGDTGAGKTTLFVDAIMAALFGTPYGKRSLMKEFITKGKKSAKLILSFEFNGIEYELIREIYRDRSDSSVILKVEGKKTIRGANNVKKYIEQELGLNQNILMHTVVVRQGDVSMIVNTTDAQRRNYFLEILQVRYFSKLREKAGNKYMELVRELTALETELKNCIERTSKETFLREEINRIENEIKSLEEKIKELEYNYEELRNAYTTLIKTKSALEEKIRRSREIEGNLNKLKNKARDIQNKISKIEKQLSQYGREKISKAQEYISKLSRYSEESATLKDLERQLDELKEKIEMKKRMDELAVELERLEELEKEHNEILDEVKRIRGEIDKLRGIKTNISKHLKELKKAEARCPVCGAILNEQKKKEREREMMEEISNIENEIESLRETLKDKESRINKLEKEIKKLTIKKGEFSSLQLSLGKHVPNEKELTLLSSRVNDLSKRVKELEQDILAFASVTSINDAKRVIDRLLKLRDDLFREEAYKKELENLDEQIKSLEQELNQLKIAIEEYAKAEKEIRAIEMKLRDIERQLIDFRNRRSELIGRIEELKKSLDEIEALKEKIKELENQIKEKSTKKLAYEILDAAFKESEFPALLLRRFIEIVEKYTNEYLQIFGMNIEVKLELGGSRGTGLLIRIYSAGLERPKETYSGGEQTLIGFAIRLGISRALVEYFMANRIPKFLIIDEGFGPLDEKKRTKLIEALYSLYRTGEFEQMIVISHQSELRNHPIFRTIIQIEKDTNNYSNVFIEGRKLC